MTGVYSTGKATPVVTVGAGGGSASLGFQQVTGLTVATKLTPPAKATQAVVGVLGQAVNWRSDGTAPTASVGMPIAANGTQVFSGAEMAAVQFIQQTATATLNVTYY